MSNGSYRPDPLISWLTGRPGILAATSLFVLYVVLQAVPATSPLLAKAVGGAGLLVALLAFVIVGDLYRRVSAQQRDADLLLRELQALRSSVDRRIEVRFLNSSEQLFATLCQLRDGATAIRLMMMRDESPVRFDESGAVVTDARGKASYVKNSPAGIEWFEGLPAWLAADPERSLERLSANSTAEMRAYQEFVEAQVEAAFRTAGPTAGHGDFATFVLDLGGLRIGELPPFLNLCIFDHDAVVLSFSGRPGRRQHPNLKGVLLRGPDIVRFFVAEYYEPFRWYISSGGRLPVAATTEAGSGRS